MIGNAPLYSLRSPAHSNSRIRRILSTLLFSDPTAKDRCLTLLTATSAPQVCVRLLNQFISFLITPQTASGPSGELSLETMEERVAELARKFSKTLVAAPALTEPSDSPTDPVKNPTPGIRQLGPEDGWRPCPIGYNGITMRL